MLFGRTNQVMIPLLDYRMLVKGGETASTINNAELFTPTGPPLLNPPTGTFGGAVTPTVDNQDQSFNDGYMLFNGTAFTFKGHSAEVFFPQ